MILIKMVSDVVTIPKKEYELLLRCKHIVESEFEENFSEDFIKAIKESEEDYREGNYLRFNSVKEAKKYFDRV